MDTKKLGRIQIVSMMFWVTFSNFLLEFLLTRLYSSIFTKDLAFLAATVAISGFSLGYLLYAYIKNLKKIEGFIFLNGLCATGIIVIFYKFNYMGSIVIYMVLSIIPFMLSGYLMAHLFKSYPKNKFGELYAIDLIGGGLAGVYFLLRFNSISFFGIIAMILISWFCCLLSNNFKSKSIIIISLTIALTGNVFLEMDMSKSIIKTLEHDYNGMVSSPFKAFSYLDAADKQLDEFAKWSLNGRMDVIELIDKKERIILTDGSASAPVMKAEVGEIPSSLIGTAASIPHLVGKQENVLLIGSGGGKDIWMSKIGNAESVHAVDVNPLTIAIANEMKDYAGDIYNTEQVKTHITDGRKYVEETDERFSHIYLSMVMTNSISNAMASLSENYLITEESFQKYYDVLEDDGRLSLMLHDGIEMFRAMNTWIRVLLNNEVKLSEVSNYLTIINGVSEKHNTIMMPVVIFYKSPIPKVQEERILSLANLFKLPIIHSPSNKFELFDESKTKLVSIEDLYQYQGLDMSPPTDDRPYFYGYNSKSQLVLKVILVAILLLAVLVNQTKVNQLSRSTSFLAILTGVGFIVFEIMMIQFASRKMGSIYGFSLIVSALLFTSGLGSYIESKKKYALNVFLLGSVVLQITAFQSIRLVDSVLANSSIVALLIFISILPVGICLGMLFPRIVKLTNSETPPTLLFFNSALGTILGSILAVLVSTQFGTSKLLFISLMIYSIAAIMIIKKTPKFTE